MSELSEHLRSLRLGRGWSFRDVAERCGVETSTVWRAEQGTGLTICTLEMIVAAYGLSLGQFFGAVESSGDLPQTERQVLTAWRTHDTMGLLKLITERES